LAVTLTQHGRRIALLMILISGLLGWLAAHTEILYADGLRYIDQAQRFDRAAWLDGLKAVDHPIYPLAVAGCHRLIGGEGPEAWQRAAQAASIVAGVLLVIPLYLIAAELFGAPSAWLACLLVFFVPLTGHVLADALSESTFLLFWCWGLWTALRFLKEGAFGWLPPTIGFGALAYLTRPEGLLLPAALIAALVLMPTLRSTRLYWPRWWAAVAFLVIGPGLLIGPYVAMKGGLGTKPAIARLLGTAPRSHPSAVERMRPLDPNQSMAKTYGLATKAMFEAVRDAVTVPLLPLGLVGLWASRPYGPKARQWLFLAVIAVASVLALIRLHATGGYCSPRHALVLALLLISAAARGLHCLLDAISIPGEWLGLDEGRFTAGPAVWAVVLGGLLAFYAPSLFAPLNAGFGGYRAAAAYLTKIDPHRSRTVDVTGWSLFYGQRPGYTFANLHEAAGDPALRWVVVREAHLRGPWIYCDQLRHLVAGLNPVATFPESPDPRQSTVFVFDRGSPGLQAAKAPPPARIR
jgi:4-amino-4-deoxy-L-arabinose transferase-like glycosyltransferase